MIILQGHSNNYQFECPCNKPYENTNITGVEGLTEAEITTLKALGAVED
ncbi:MAG: hypothetical protein AAGG00_17155 [Cyanobacteria bacterium P01_H01_bin.150]